MSARSTRSASTVSLTESADATARTATNRASRAVLHDMLRRHARRNPHRAAVVERPVTGERRELSYAEFDAHANAVAARWIAAGVSRGDVVAAMGVPSIELYVAYYAALRCGAAFTVLNPAATATELTYHLEHAQPALVVAGSEQEAGVAFLCASSDPVPRTETLDGLLDAARRSPAPEPDVTVLDTDVAMLVYTSGTESLPKGVLLTHRCFLAGTTFSWVLDGYIRPHDRFLLLAPIHTTAGLGTSTNLITIGATIVIAPGWSANDAPRIIAEEAVTNMSQTPTFYRRLVSAPGYRSDLLRSVEQCHTYGGLTQPEVFERISADVPGMVWASYWGQSELAQLGTIGWFRTADDIPRRDIRWIGKPVPHLDVRVVDDSGRDAEIGELLVRSPALMAGYLGDPAATERAMTDGWLRTGDIVAISDDLDLFFLDRRKDMIKTGGMNVSSLEVERTLTSHASVAEVAVVGLPDDVWGEAVTAVVVGAPGSTVDVHELRRHCKLSLAGYQVPKRIVAVAALPYDAQGKVRKRSLRAGIRPGPAGPEQSPC
jgi:acyl-CoA synthetase (AMP-forming)/AMP-acid ligase II